MSKNKRSPLKACDRNPEVCLSYLLGRSPAVSDLKWSSNHTRALDMQGVSRKEASDHSYEVLASYYKSKDYDILPSSSEIRGRRNTSYSIYSIGGPPRRKVSIETHDNDSTSTDDDDFSPVSYRQTLGVARLRTPLRSIPLAIVSEHYDITDSWLSLNVPNDPRYKHNGGIEREVIVNRPFVILTRTVVKGAMRIPAVNGSVLSIRWTMMNDEALRWGIKCTKTERSNVEGDFNYYISFEISNERENSVVFPAGSRFAYVYMRYK